MCSCVLEIEMAFTDLLTAFRLSDSGSQKCTMYANIDLVLFCHSPFPLLSLRVDFPNSMQMNHDHHHHRHRHIVKKNDIT